MTTKMKLLAAGAVAVVGAVTAMPAAAQSVGTADLQGAMVKTKAFANANTQIQTQYKAQLAQADVRRKALDTQLQPLLISLDTNKDGQLSQAELQAAAAAKNPALAQIQAQKSAGDAELVKLEGPASLAQQYALEQISAKLSDAVKAVVARRSIGLLVTPQAVLFATPTADLTPDITAELDKTVTTVGTTPPAGWQPGSAGGAPGGTPGAGGTPGTTPPVTPPSTGKKPKGR